MKTHLLRAEKKIGHNFLNKELLREALTHSSFAYENKEKDLSDNEILEFLGDSVLGLIVADYLRENYPYLPEGDLTKLKSSVTNSATLSAIARAIKLDRFILLGKGEEKSGGRKKTTILSGALEAVIAAIYLDAGLYGARNFLVRHLRSFFKKIDARKFHINNYKSALQEYFQKENLPPPLYKTITVKGPHHKKQFMVEVFSEKRSLGKAQGHSKKEAEQNAAQKVLKSLWGRKMRTLTSDTFLLKKK